MVEILFQCIKGVYDDYKWTAKTQKIGYKYKCFGFLVNTYGPGKLAFYGFDQKKTEVKWQLQKIKKKKAEITEYSLLSLVQISDHLVLFFFFFCVIVQM